MPSETIIVLCGIVAAFVFFAAVLAYGDLTWSKAAQRTDDRRH